MGKIRVGNKINSVLNGEWAGHVRGWMKRYTSSRRRNEEKQIIADELHANAVNTSAGYTLETHDETGQVGIRCYDCGMTSYSVGDISHRYCHNCKKYHGKKARK